MTTFFRLGNLVDHYRLDSLIYSGTMACLFRATDIRTGDAVAVKVPRPGRPFWSVFNSTIESEVRIGRKLNHPGIARVLSDESARGRYAVIEWAHGTSVRKMLDMHGKLPIEQGVAIALNICDALQYIHAQGIAHLDLKPENVIVAPDDQIKIVDFGIARELRKGLSVSFLAKAMGTPDYASPEQLKRKTADERSDIYSLGLILYEMLAGEIPFCGTASAIALELRSAIDPEPPSEIDPEIPPFLDGIVCHAIARDPAKRYASAGEFGAELSAIQKILECELAESV